MSFRTSPKTLTAKKGGANKLVLGFLACAVMALVGTAGVANATSGPGPTGPGPTTKDQCKHDGWKHFGFKNQGQCVSWVAHMQQGGGYGNGNVNANANINLTLNNSDHNVINIIVRWVFGG